MVNVGTEGESLIVKNLYKQLEEAVREQPYGQRLQTIMSGGLLHFRIPRSMDITRGPCCYVGEPCRVHRLLT
jgi:hypothetical protein